MRCSLYFRYIFSSFVLFFSYVASSQAQQKIDLNNPKYGNQVYIFSGFPQIYKCDEDGVILDSNFYNYTHVHAENNSTFTLEGEKDSSTYIIKFKRWNYSVYKNVKYYFAIPKDSQTLNMEKQNKNGKDSFKAKKNAIKSKIIAIIANSDEAYFLISKVDLLTYGAVYEPVPKVIPTYGTITYLARIRPKEDTTRGRWTTDLNLGFTFGLKHNLSKNLSISGLAGISITKITLDSISTLGVVTSTNEKPSLTPSLNLLFSYKNVSFGVAIGWDFINDDTKESKAWIYNQKKFYAVGFGINIFNSSDTQTPNTSQKTSP